MELTQTSLLSNTTIIQERELLDVSFTVDQVFVPKGKAPKTTGVAGSTLNLFSSTVGAGLVALSIVFHQTGILLGSIGVIISTIFGVMTSDLLIRCKNLTRRTSYMGFAEAAFKRKGYWLIIFSQFATNIGYCLAYMTVLGVAGQTMYSQLSGNCMMSEDDMNMMPLLCNEYMYPVAAGFLIFPLSYAPSMGFLSSLSGVKFVSLIIFTIMIIVFYTIELTNKTLLPQINYFPSFDKPVDILGSINVLTLTICFQFNLVAVYKSLSPQTDKNLKVSIRLSSLFSALIILIVGITGYASFGVGKDTLLQSFTVENLGAPLFIIVEGVFFIACLVSFPVVFMEARNSLVEICLNIKYGKQQYLSEFKYEKDQSERKLSKFTYIVVVFATHSLVVVVAAFKPNLQIFSTFLGATFLNGFVYFFPTVFYLVLSRGKGDKIKEAYFFAGFGLLMSVLGIWSAIDDILMH